MESTLTFVMTASERDMIRKALEVIADEYRHIGESVASRYLAEDFKSDASKYADLAGRISRLVDAKQMEEQVKSYLLRGDKIYGIKYVREQTSMSLKEAKDYVDKIQAQYAL